MVIKRVGPVSVAKNAAIIYAVLGLVVGSVFSLIALAGGFSQRNSAMPATIAAIAGVGAIVMFPIFYACIGFVGALIASALYNVVAGMVGGIEIDLE